MNATELQKLLKQFGACWDARAWAKGKSLEEAWGTCDRADWMLWLAGRMAGEDGWTTRQQIVLAACDCATLALPFVKAGEERPRIAIDTARRWAHGEASIEDVRAARNAATAAAKAAYAADVAYAYAAAAAAAAAATATTAKAATAAATAAAKAAAAADAAYAYAAAAADAAYAKAAAYAYAAKAATYAYAAANAATAAATAAAKAAYARVKIKAQCLEIVRRSLTPAIIRRQNRRWPNDHIEHLDLGQPPRMEAR